MMKQFANGLIILIIILNLTNGFDANGKIEDHDIKKKPLMENLGSFSSDLATTYWQKVKFGVNNVHAYFFDPPTIEGSDDLDEGENGAGKKVKTAVTKSLSKSKAAVEESAKTAAKVAEETVHTTTEKLKKTISSKSDKGSTTEL